MDTQNIIENILRESGKESVLESMTDLFVRKIAKCGLRVSADDREKIRRWLVDEQRGPLTLDTESSKPRNVELNVSARENRRLSGKLKKLGQADADEAVALATDGCAEFILKALMKNWPRNAKQEQREDTRIKKHIEKLWGEPIGQLSMMLTVTREIGDEIIQELDAAPKSQTPCLLEVMRKLHARACQIAYEIIVLLRAGLPDGAMARWRSLHEVTVVLHFICQHGESLARRYLDHSIVESYRAALKHDVTCSKSGRLPLTDSEWEPLRNSHSELLKKYGKEFGQDYGWSAKILNKTKPRFSDIQNAVELDHWRADYQLASYNIHAGAKGALFRLCTPYTESILTGASDYGLSDPGQNTAICLTQVSATLLQFGCTLERLSAVKALEKLNTEVLGSFTRAHDKIDSFIDESEEDQS